MSELLTSRLEKTGDAEQTHGSASPVSRSALARVCIVTQEINGPSRNGGIGTAYTALAQLLVAAGHEVTVLYLPGSESDRHPVEHWREQYAWRKIRLVPLPEPDVALYSSEHLVRAYSAYLWLRKHEREFDLLHFHDWLGVGYYAALARRQGLAFQDTRICVGVHGPTLWIKEANRQLLDSVAELERDAIERRCVELADVVWSPSEYLLNWMRERGWRLPRDHFVRPYLTPELRAAGLVPAVRTAGASPAARQNVRELVFFGRLETRKGLLLFCDALDRLAEAAGWSCPRVTFLGRPAMIGELRADVLIEERSERWPFAVRVLTDFDHAEALAYVRGPGRVAVMPSLQDNSPLAVLECLQLGVPFLAAEVGGIPEVVAEEDRARVLFAPTPAALADRLQKLLSEGISPAHSAVDQEANAAAWREWHRSETHEPPATSHEPRATVSVCLVTHDRPELLAQAVESLRRQDYPHFEVILVDDGSRRPEALAFLEQLEPEFRDRGWKIVRQENRYLGAARNTAARHAGGEYLLFMDDDNLAKPHELSTLVAVAERTGADVIATLMDIFAEVGPDGEPVLDRRWLVATVPALAVALSRNCFGDANSLVRRSAFEEVGGFTEDYGVTHEDWEFMIKAALHGLKMEVVPEALFWYRVTPGSMIRSTSRYANYRRHLRPLLEEVPEPYRDLIRLAQGLSLRYPEEMDVPVGPAPLPGRPLRYDVADALNARLKRLGVLHRLGRSLLRGAMRIGLRVHSFWQRRRPRP